MWVIKTNDGKYVHPDDLILPRQNGKKKMMNERLKQHKYWLNEYETKIFLMIRNTRKDKRWILDL